MQKHVNLVDLVKSFPTNIYLQNLASMMMMMMMMRDIEEELSEYVRYCYGYLSKFSFFSLSPCPFSQSSFRTDSYSNEYLLAKIGVDTAENEPLEVWGEN